MKLSALKIMAVVFLAAMLMATLGCNCLCSAKKPTPTAPIRLDVGKAAWTFVVSGDSRNCGDIVMPAIAAGAKQDHATFYWHLGDLRATYYFDEDYVQGVATDKQDLLISNYLGDAEGKKIGEWDDFLQYQVGPFGDMPFFLGIGNHETIWPQSRPRFTKYFASMLDRQELKSQRLFDLQKHDPEAKDSGPKTYYHWIVGTVDFIYLDNASKDQLDADQVKWFAQVLKDDQEPNSGITSVVVGMHAALPNSLSESHSMNQAGDRGLSGLQVYKDLLDFKKAGKEVYVLASHSHFFMTDVYKTKYWDDNGGELPGWIIGTAGAIRYRIPDIAVKAKVEAKTDVYGYLLGNVDANGKIKFDFHEFKESDIPKATLDRYSSKVHWCFTDNKKMTE